MTQTQKCLLLNFGLQGELGWDTLSSHRLPSISVLLRPNLTRDRRLCDAACAMHHCMQVRPSCPLQVVTVNDYLARRDSEWVGQVHRFLGLQVGLVQQGLNVSSQLHTSSGRQHMSPIMHGCKRLLYRVLQSSELTVAPYLQCSFTIA